MKGTEKQIKYAMDILSNVKGEAEIELEKGEKHIAERAAVGKTSRIGIAKKTNAEKVLAAIDQVRNSDIHAGVIINTICTYSSFLGHLEMHDGDVERMIRYTI